MISYQQFIEMSLELNLFFLRIVKEHAIFIEAGFPPKYVALINEAKMHGLTASNLLIETIQLAEGKLSEEVLSSGQFVTNLTLDAERKTQELTGIVINSNITTMELGIKPGQPVVNQTLLQKISSLNQRAYVATSAFVNYLDRVHAEDVSCKIFNYNYAHLMDHVNREMRHYMNMLEKIQKREEMTVIMNAVDELAFWNTIMEEHAEFIRGLLDPTERQLFDKANQFAHEYEELVKESEAIQGDSDSLDNVVMASLKKTIQFRDFKRQGGIGILSCNIKSLISPLLADHVLREANHYLRMLRIIENMMQAR